MTSKKVAGFGGQIPPQIDHVKIYFDQQELPQEAETFYSQHDRGKWKTITGQPVKNWKTEAVNWIWEIKLRNPHMRF
jgi:ribonuclease HI